MKQFIPFNDDEADRIGYWLRMFEDKMKASGQRMLLWQSLWLLAQCRAGIAPQFVRFLRAPYSSPMPGLQPGWIFQNFSYIRPSAYGGKLFSESLLSNMRELAPLAVKERKITAVPEWWGTGADNWMEFDWGQDEATACREMGGTMASVLFPAEATVTYHQHFGAYDSSGYKWLEAAADPMIMDAVGPAGTVDDTCVESDCHAVGLQSTVVLKAREAETALAHSGEPLSVRLANQMQARYENAKEFAGSIAKQADLIQTVAGRLESSTRAYDTTPLVSELADMEAELADLRAERGRLLLQLEEAEAAYAKLDGKYDGSMQAGREEIDKLNLELQRTRVSLKDVSAAYDKLHTCAESGTTVANVQTIERLRTELAERELSLIQLAGKLETIASALTVAHFTQTYPELGYGQNALFQYFQDKGWISKVPLPSPDNLTVAERRARSEAYELEYRILTPAPRGWFINRPVTYAQPIRNDEGTVSGDAKIRTHLTLLLTGDRMAGTQATASGGFRALRHFMMLDPLTTLNRMIAESGADPALAKYFGGWQLMEYQDPTNPPARSKEGQRIIWFNESGKQVVAGGYIGKEYGLARSPTLRAAILALLEWRLTPSAKAPRQTPPESAGMAQQTELAL